MEPRMTSSVLTNEQALPPTKQSSLCPRLSPWKALAGREVTVKG